MLVYRWQANGYKDMASILLDRTASQDGTGEEAGGSKRHEKPGKHWGFLGLTGTTDDIEIHSYEKFRLLEPWSPASWSLLVPISQGQCSPRSLSLSKSFPNQAWRHKSYTLVPRMEKDYSNIQATPAGTGHNFVSCAYELSSTYFNSWKAAQLLLRIAVWL